MIRELVPLYTWAGDIGTWRARLDRLTAGSVVVVTGPKSGPPLARDADLAAHIDDIRTRHLLPFGYVPLGYGDRSVEEVLDDLTDWHVLHGITRVFFDEWPAGWGHRHLGALWGAVRGYTGRGSADRPILAINPGITVASLTATAPPAGTLIVTHEAATMPDRRPQRWEVALVHSHPSPAEATDTLDTAGWQWGHVTSDGRDGNPWDQAAA